MATAAFGEQRRDLSIGRIFERSFQVIRAYPLQTLGVTFALTTVPTILLRLVGMSAAWTTALIRNPGGISYTSIVGGGLGIMLLWLVTYGAVTQVTLAQADGRKPDLGEMLTIGAKRSLPLLAVYLLYALATTIGFALLIVPGIFLAVMWSIATTAVVAERPGVFGAFGRSAALTKGARWKVLGVLLVAFILYMVIVMVGGVLTVASSGSLAALQTGVQPPFGFAQLVAMLINTVALTWMMVLFAALFIELREWKEGPDTDRLAEIFA
ncbi:MAG: hypothetical protein P0Y64_05885 [Candidatus Sphingomonas colombiensis]|nr:hypothetical protein [Sphingomonas sp.]WEK44336.1 MAG: hypothetical protein P0Y64_05885 [Sphingomonas sp.]